jgi:hypothetical protein
MKTKWAALLLLAFLFPAACIPAIVYVSPESPESPSLTPSSYASLTPIRTPTPTLVPTNTPPPPTYTPVVIPTPDMVETFCTGSKSPWSCSSCGDYTETRWQGDEDVAIFSTKRSTQSGMCDVGLPQWKYELTLPDTWYCAARGYFENNISCANQSRKTFDLLSIHSEIPAHIADQAIAIFSEGGWTSYKPVVGSNENVVWREAKSVQSRPVVRILSQVDGNNIILRYFFKHKNRVYVFATKFDEMEHLLATYNFDFDSPEFAAYIELFESVIASMRFGD